MIFLQRFEVVTFDLAIARNCNKLLTESAVQLERNAFTNPQYHGRELVEVNIKLCERSNPGFPAGVENIGAGGEGPQNLMGA